MDAEQLTNYTAADYYAMTEEERIELIEGVIYDQASPNRRHQDISGLLFRRIADYIDAKGGKCRVYPAPFDVQLSEDTVVVPDISVICDPDKLTKQGCNGAPDWIIEIVSPNNAKRDYLQKLLIYNRAGVREYWIVDPEDESILVYDLTGEKMIAQTYSMTDTVKVGIYEDLVIDFADISARL